MRGQSGSGYLSILIKWSDCALVSLWVGDDQGNLLHKEVGKHGSE